MINDGPRWAWARRVHHGTTKIHWNFKNQWIFCFTLMIANDTLNSLENKVSVKAITHLNLAILDVACVRKS